MTFTKFGTYCVVQCSVCWNPMVAEVWNLLLHVVDLAFSILSVKETSSNSVHCGHTVCCA